MKHQIIRCLGVVCTLLSTISYAQSVGIGTETPNSNAILELVAPDANQGLLVPRLSTAERIATSFTNNLSATDNGLLVYDSDEQKFYFWMTNQWIEIASGNIDALPDQSGQVSRFLTTDGANAQWSDIDFSTLTNVPTGLSDGDNDTQLSDADIAALGYIKSANDADADASNEFQDLTLAGNTLSLTNSTASVDLSPFAGTNTDNQTLGLSGADLSITGGNTIDISSINTNLSEAEVDAFANNNGYLTAEVDGSATNEIQDISTSGAAGNISLSSGSTLNLNVDDADASTTNEIQDIFTTGAAGNITLSSGSTLNLNVDDADASATNEIELPTQIPADNGLFLQADGSGGVDFVAEVDGSITNEIQDISTSGAAGNISLSSGSTLNLNVDDADASATNEIELPTQIPADNGLFLQADGSGGVDYVAEVDGSTTNEIQDISTSGAAGNISLSSGSTLNLNVDDADASATNEIELPTQIPADNGLFLQADGSGGVDYVAEVDGSTTNEIQDISTSGAAGNISLSSGSTLNLNVDDADASATNEIELPTQIPADNGRFLQADGSGGVDYVAEVDGSTTNEVNTGMSLSGTTVQVTDANGTVGVDIGGTFATDTELAALNESQWTTNGTSINYSTGNVNIGSGTIPTSRLQLSTNNSGSTTPQLTLLESDGTSDASMNFNSGGSNFAIGVDGGDNYFKVSGSSAVGTNDRMIIDNTGAVGVGANPFAQFHVTTSGTLEGSAIRATNNHSGSSAKNGVLIELDNQGTAAKAGISVDITGTSASSQALRGNYNNITPTDGVVFGTHNNIVSAGTGLRFGSYAAVTGAAGNGNDIYGFRAQMTHAGSGTTYAFYSIDFGSGGGTQYGMFTSGEDHNYFSGNVGIGQALPSAKLDVVGDTELNGTLTVTDDVEIPAANDYTYATAKTKQLSFHPTDFVLMNFNGDNKELIVQNFTTPYIYFAGSLTTLGYATTPVRLPDGAVVTNFEAWLYDDDGSNFVRASLYRSQVGTINSNIRMAEVETTAQSTSVQALSTTSITNPTIDNNNYSYRLLFTARENAPNTRLYGVRITYTVTQAD